MARYLNSTLKNSQTLFGYAATYGSTSDNTDNLIIFSGNSEILPVEFFRIFTSESNQLDRLLARPAAGLGISGDYSNNITTTSMHQIVDARRNDINFTNVYLLKPSINADYFKYGLLKDDDDAADIFHPHNIILPVISEEKSSGVARERTFSALHSSNTWADSGANKTIDYLHMSRVMAGLMDRNFSDSQTNYTWNLINIHL